MSAYDPRQPVSLAQSRFIELSFGAITVKFEKFNEVAELVGIVAIVASLVFVGLQLRQDQVFARSELGAGSFESLASLRQEMTGSEFAATFAKMLEEPAQLTTAEQLQVNAYLDAAKFLIIRECYLYERGIFTECDIAVREYGPYFFGNSYAQSWWRLQSPKELTFLPGWVSDEISGIDPEYNLKELRAIQGEH